MAPRQSSVRPIHFLLAPRMARRLYLWTLANPSLTYQEALKWESVLQLERARLRQAHGRWLWHLKAPWPERAPLRAGLFSPDFLATMRSTQRSASGS
ncbi:hypothetical protein AB0387_16560 [Streptomyces sp. NPDC089173]|uniref:hypothetical protein n=1 Tax=Streptomyces sp. NPDC089173 TaxID=3154965 RepID=UPI00344DADB6